ncbi:MAG: DUF2339 domain-containing protein, partial [Planctomycetota bacterium]
LFAYAFTCVLLTLETYFHCDQNLNAPDSLLLDYELTLWTVIAGATLLAIRRWYDTLELGGVVLSIASLGAGALVYLGSLMEHDSATILLALHPAALVKAAYVAVLIGGATMLRRIAPDGLRQWPDILETLGHVFVAFLLAAELDRWQSANGNDISPTLSLALLSAAWACQAVGLIGWGLRSRVKLRRMLGFILFGITLIKVVFIDTAELSRAMQVISFLACGVLLIVSAGIYQRFRAMFMPASPPDSAPDDQPEEPPA